MRRIGWSIGILILLILAGWWLWPRAPVEAPPQGPAQVSESPAAAPTEPQTPSPVPPQEFAERAKGHWDAIVSQDLSILADDYSANPILHWIGGALEGEYVGEDAVVQVWDQFFGSNEVRGYEFKNRFTQNRTVSADVIFIVFREGAIARIPVRYQIRFDDSKKIVEETWRVEPSLLEE